MKKKIFMVLFILSLIGCKHEKTIYKDAKFKIHSSYYNGIVYKVTNGAYYWYETNNGNRIVFEGNYAMELLEEYKKPSAKDK